MYKKALTITAVLSMIPSLSYAEVNSNSNTNTITNLNTNIITSDNAAQIKSHLQDEKQKINNQIDQFNQDLHSLAQQKDQVRQDIKNKTNETRQSINAFNEKAKTNISEHYTEQKNNLQNNTNTIKSGVQNAQKLNLSDTPLLQHLIKNNSAPLITINMNDQPLTLHKDWFNRKQQTYIQSLKDKLKQGKINEHQLHLEILQLLHQNLENYIKHHETIKLKDLIQKGFNLSELNNDLRTKLEALLKKYNNHEITNTKYQHELLDILNQHLIDTNKKVQKLNDFIKKEQSGADLFSSNIADSISNDLKQDNTIKQSVQKTPTKQEKQTSFLPITGEMPKVYITGVIATLFLGLLLLLKKK